MSEIKAVLTEPHNNQLIYAYIYIYVATSHIRNIIYIWVNNIKSMIPPISLHKYKT